MAFVLFFIFEKKKKVPVQKNVVDLFIF